MLNNIKLSLVRASLIYIWNALTTKDIVMPHQAVPCSMVSQGTTASSEHSLVPGVCTDGSIKVRSHYMLPCLSLCVKTFPSIITPLTGYAFAKYHVFFAKTLSDQKTRLKKMQNTVEVRA